MTDRRARVEHLRRRVQMDPSSIAFAQLAEEYRRSGALDEAIETCRTGLARHPGYGSARVTLGRALLQRNQLDDAERELNEVVRTAPESLAALRGLAEIARRRGDVGQALATSRRALALAQNDPDLQRMVADLTSTAAASRPVPSPSVPPTSVPSRSVPPTPGSSTDRNPLSPLTQDAERRRLAILEQWLLAIDGFRTERRA